VRRSRPDSSRPSSHRPAGLGPLVLITLGFSGGMDQQPDGPRTLPPDLHRRGPRRVVPRRATHMGESPGVRTRTGLRGAVGSARLRAAVRDRGRPGDRGARLPAGRALVLLNGGFMKRLLGFPMLTLALIVSVPVIAATKTVTLSVPGMNWRRLPDYGQEGRSARCRAWPRRT